MLFILPVDLPSGQWSGSWFNRKTAPVGFEEVLAAHKGAFCFSSPPGSSTLLGNSLAADIILLCTEWQTIFLPWLSPPSRLSLLPSCSLPLSLSLPPYLSVVRCRLSFCAPFTQKVNAPMCTSAIKVQAFRKPPKNTSVFILWRRTTVVEPKTAWKSGSGRTRPLRQQHTSRQLLDEWEFVWCLGADGERL